MKTKTQKWRRLFARKILRLKYYIQIDASIIARGKETGNIVVNGEYPSKGDVIEISGALDLRNASYYHNLKYGGTLYSFKEGEKSITYNSIEQIKREVDGKTFNSLCPHYKICRKENFTDDVLKNSCLKCEVSGNHLRMDCVCYDEVK